MRNRFASLTVALAIAAPGLAAQDATTDETAQSHAVEILETAIAAISEEHMESFEDATLWAAALEGLYEALGDSSTMSLEAGQTRASQTANAQRIAMAIREIQGSHEEPLNDSTLWEAAIDGVIRALKDPYAALFTPVETAEWEEQTSGNYSGIGLQITLLNERVTVTGVFRGFPAEQAGVQMGDVIVGVNQHDATEWSTDMAADSIRGPVGTRVMVRFARAGYEEPITLDITRAQVHVPAVQYGVLDSGIGYVVMDRVARNAAREMNDALAELASTKGLIIDLRRNPGGFLDESLMLSDLFLRPGSTLASTEQRVPGAPAARTRTDSYRDRWPQIVPELPIAILVDRYTASGAEILAGALQDYDRAVVLGERSFGKGVVQTVSDLPFNRKLRFTTGSWNTPLGRSLQRARDSYGRPLEEDLDTFPRVTTPGGRTLINGGGVFPDLEIQDDTLTLLERELITDVNENQVQLGLRMAEAGFAAATARQEAGQGPGMTDGEFDAFIGQLESDGVSTELLAQQEIRDYLRWRMRMNVALRMEDIGGEADVRMERDPVLTEAVRLISTANSQASLFEAARQEAESRRGEGASSN